MATCSGGWLGIVHLPCWLATAKSLSRLVGVGLGTLAQVVVRFPTLKASHNIGAWNSISSGATINLGRCMLLVGTRRLEGWPWSEPGWQSGIWNPDPALLGSGAR